MNQLKNYLQKLSWAYVVLIVAAMLGYSFYSLDPTEIETAEQAIAAGKKNYEDMNRKIAEAEAFQKEFEQRKKKYAEMVQHLQQMQGALPKEFFLPELSSSLLREAKQLGIQINAIIPDGQETTHQNYNSIGFQLDASGTFIQLFIFMDRLSNMTRLMNVQAFDFKKDTTRTSVTLGGELGSFAGTNFSGGRTVYPGLNATFRIVTYRYRGGN